MEKILKLIETNQLEQAQVMLQERLQKQPEDAGAYFLLGQIFCKKQEWGMAINCFRQALEIAPDYPRAKTQIDMANAILGYFTPDMFNP
ncbi:tetratricopeptide repeat protein [Gaoshiqia sediminis]|uniref:Tetratricopeptide repeat protein n=1 Tax=Gaoshiqia sediminis TaxID=2986998 RepID=A0AA41Y718_9BACT|nr:tetratricopeptide repeat protein [Gaoshiqia sediminis]MCW0484611.1 tetratricopeptide repeat protein [Gaoshiqia sediminis]